MDNQLNLFTQGVLANLVDVRQLGGKKAKSDFKHIHYFRGDLKKCSCGLTESEFKKNQPIKRRSDGNSKK